MSPLLTIWVLDILCFFCVKYYPSVFFYLQWLSYTFSLIACLWIPDCNSTEKIQLFPVAPWLASPTLTSPIKPVHLENTQPHSPAFVGDDSFLPQLVVFVRADCQPVAQLAIIKCVRHFEDLSSGERKTLRSLLLVLKVSPDEKRVTSAGCQNVLVN